MDTADFLFPRDLEVQPTAVSKVLVMGSCMAEDTAKAFRVLAPNTEFDWLLFNGPADLPDLPAATVQGYDFQYIQLSLRHIVRDEVVRFADFQKPGVAEEILDRSVRMLQLTLDSALAYNRAHGLLTFVANFFVPQVPVVAALDRIGSAVDFAALVRRLNDELARLAAGYRNVFIADVDAVAAACGKRFFLDDVVAFYAHSHSWGPTNHAYDTAPEFNAPGWGRLDPLRRMEEIYGTEGTQMFPALWRQVECLFRTVCQTDMVKMVIFDLDDTLWRGQIVEHYLPGQPAPVLHGWPVGLWEAIQHLRARGIVTAICSKNEESLVRERWSRAVMTDWLSLEDFAFVEIGWAPKAQSIDRMIRQAGLTPKSVVFVDDNPVERDSVRTALPGIRVIGANPHETRRILLWSPETQVATLSAETVGREASIRQMKHREEDRDALSREEFLRDLDCRVRLLRIETMDHPEAARCQELLNKTNQFNTTGLRWSAAQLAYLLSIGATLYAFHARDRYSDYGLVGVLIYRDGLFVQFAMSCRVLGLGIEQAVIGGLMTEIMAREARQDFAARIFETDSNMVCRDVFLRCGFQTSAEDATLQLWRGAAAAEKPEHVALSFEALAA